MLVTIDVSDRSEELRQISGSHAMLTLIHLAAQPEPDPVSDIKPVKTANSELKLGSDAAYSECEQQA